MTSRVKTLSVIICTHNPVRKAMERVLVGLEKQSLPREQWELLLIDNASAQKLSSQYDLHWHSRARHVVEETLGLTAARLRGIRESAGELLVFVDDDNVLAPDYLEAAACVEEEWPRLGAWGGQIIPIYEVEPPAELRRWIDVAFGRTLAREAWTNVGKTPATTPWGAGMVVRRVVAECYAKLASSDEVRFSLDRTGESLVSCGDYDLAWTSHGLGLGTGLFPSLKLEHLIPRHRLTREYLLKLTEGISCSSQLLRLFWGLPLVEVSRSERLYQLYRDFRLPPLEKAFINARLRGEQKGRELASDLKNRQLRSTKRPSDPGIEIP